MESVQKNIGNIPERSEVARISRPAVVYLENDSNIYSSVNDSLRSQNIERGSVLPLTITVENPKNDSPIKYDGSTFSFDNNQINWPKDNFEHYSKLFDLEQDWNKIEEAYRENPNSKRLIISFWEQKYVESDIAPSLMSIQFLKQGGGISMFVHMRSNKFEQKFDLNYNMLSSVHRYVSNRLGVERGSYNHIVNAMEV